MTRECSRGSLAERGGMATESPLTISRATEEVQETSKKTTVKFQCGLLRETETFVGDDVEYLYRDHILDFVCDMLSVKVRWLWQHSLFL